MREKAGPSDTDISAPYSKIFHTWNYEKYIYFLHMLCIWWHFVVALQWREALWEAGEAALASSSQCSYIFLRPESLHMCLNRVGEIRGSTSKTQKTRVLLSLDF